MTEDEVEELQY